MKMDAEAIVQQAVDKVVSILADKPLYAEMILNQLLKAIPDHPKGVHLLGLVKQRMGCHEEAVHYITRAIELEPNNPDNYNNLAISYANLDDYDKAIEYLQKAISLSPDHQIYLNNLALQYRQKGEFPRAISLFEKALQCRPTPEIWCNLGGLYHEIKDINRAVRCFETAIALDPDCAAAHVDLSFCLCSMGQWEKGLEEYEWRFTHFSNIQHYNQAYDLNKKWSGESLEGKTILLYGEQGLGDMIQFARYIPKLKEMKAKVILHCPEPLEKLLLASLDLDDVFICDIVELAKNSSLLPEHDCQCSLISLPYILKDYKIDGSPYLKAPARLNLRVTEEYGKTFNIGVVWAGSPAHPNDETRSAFLKDFQPLSDIPGVKLFSLQVGGCRRAYTNGKRVVDYAEGAENVRMVDMVPEIKNYSDTASIISGLDLVVCVDTSMVHLAGALGVPCWVLMPFVPDWRWGLEGERTEWYDSVRMYRQERPRNWLHVIERIARDVKKDYPSILQDQ